MQTVAPALTAVTSPPACAARCFYSSVIDSLATLVSSSRSVRLLPPLCAQVERGGRGSRTWSQTSVNTYATQISVFPFLRPSPEGIGLPCADEGRGVKCSAGWMVLGRHRVNT